MTEGRFLDTNILLRHLLGDSHLQSGAATQLFDNVASGDLSVLTSATVIFEAFFALTKLYRIDPARVARELRSVVELDSIRIPDKSVLIHAFDLFATHNQLSFADCYHAALSLAHCNGEIYTFDKDFRRIPGITRLEPGE